ncbi:MAG: GNAT family N-acetyltransferase [Bacteroidales bacterium]|nr:GNAT family N-acetyltransferase [Bacteroidales bacterium]
MGLFDFFNKNKKERERKEQLRLKQEAEEKRKAEEQQSQEEVRQFEEEFERQVYGEKAYLAVFSASWCGPSKRFLNEIQQGGINNFTLIDVEKEQSLASKYSIISVPTTLLLDEQGGIIKKWIGYDDEDPNQSKFVTYIKTAAYNILPYADFGKSTNRSTQQSTQSNPKEDAICIKQDNRKSFYRLEDIRYRSMGGDLMLCPYDAEAFINYPDASVLPLLANTEKINRFLPGLGFSDESTTKKRLEGYLHKTEKQLGVTYVIRGSNVPIGMIFINSPLYNSKTINLAIWTIDFYITEAFEHRGIMYNSIIRVLNEMKTIMGVTEVYALVDRDNIDCRKLLGNGLFEQVDNKGFSNSDRSKPAPLVYMIDLSKIKFERG